METKSRYEVIAELESQKRDLIQERDGLQDEEKAKEDAVRDLKRSKEDTIIIMDRRIADAEIAHERFTKTMTERKTTVNELIKSVDDSLARFNTLAK